jgi:hypothetical protein
MRHDDEPTSRIAHTVNVVGVEDGPGADQRLGPEGAGQLLDRAQRVRRVERDLDDAKTG